LLAGLLFASLPAAAADGPVQLQSPDGRRTVGAAEARAPITLDGARVIRFRGPRVSTGREKCASFRI